MIWIGGPGQTGSSEPPHFRRLTIHRWWTAWDMRWEESMLWHNLSLNPHVLDKTIEVRSADSSEISHLKYIPPTAWPKGHSALTLRISILLRKRLSYQITIALTCQVTSFTSLDSLMWCIDLPMYFRSRRGSGITRRALNLY